jgi:WD40 repeat protein
MGGIHAADVSVDGKLVVASGHDPRVLLWDAKTEKLLTTLTGHTNTVEAVRFFPQGGRIVTGGWDRKLK